MFKFRKSNIRHIEKTQALKNSPEYASFIRAGGGKSGIYDVSDRKTEDFVKKYRKFIPKREVYMRDKSGSLIPKYRRFRKKTWRR